MQSVSFLLREPFWGIRALTAVGPTVLTLRTWHRGANSHGAGTEMQFVSFLFRRSFWETYDLALQLSFKEVLLGNLRSSTPLTTRANSGGIGTETAVIFLLWW